MRTAKCAALALALVVSVSASAATVWKESVNGDLSNNPLAPTILTLAPGSNDVIGKAGGPPGSGALAPFDQDFFTFTVPNGYELTSLDAVKVHLLDPTDTVAFIAIQGGSQITYDVSPPFNGTAAGLLGWLHVAPGDQGTNILPAMGASGFGATGFTGPLGPGQYSVWVQDDLPFKYDFSFEIGVPEPSTWAMMLVGFAALSFAGYGSSRGRTWLSET
jgi:hypothetical protein